MNNHLNELGMAWIIIANADPSSEEWRKEAEKWRKRYLEILRLESKEEETEPSGPYRDPHDWL